jgi:hypothetical protein
LSMFSQSFESMISITITSYFRVAKIGGKMEISNQI